LSKTSESLFLKTTELKEVLDQIGRFATIKLTFILQNPTDFSRTKSLRQLLLPEID
jgi:hypothetical protein